MKSICTQCGTTETDDDKGYCINDHDSWLEPTDSIELLHTTSEKMMVRPAVLIAAMNDEYTLEVSQPCQI